MHSDLFSNQRPAREEVFEDVFLLSAFASSDKLMPSIGQIAEKAPFRHMMTPMGKLTRAAMTNCGDFGWVSDKSGYRYASVDPESGRAWPAMPESFRKLAKQAVSQTPFTPFDPDACLINRYDVGSSMGAHQDRDEKDFSQPIVSVSLGLPATFLIYGKTRKGAPKRINLFNGDVLVFGGKARLMYHGVAVIKADPMQPNLKYRYNLTFRQSQ